MSYNLEELAQTLFEESGDALFLFDPDTEQLLDANPMAQRLSGCARRELLRQPVTYLFRAEAPGGLQRLRHACKKTGIFHSQEGFLLRHQKDGVWVPVNLTITRLHAEPRTLGLITARDISERREAQARLQKTEAELRQVLTSISDYLWSADLDAQGRVTCRFFSPVVESITGRPPEFYYAGPERWLSTVHPEDRPHLEAALGRIRSGLSARAEQEYRVVWPDGTVRWVRDSVVVHGQADGPVLRLDGVVTDISARKRAEHQLRLVLDLTLAIAEAQDIHAALRVGLRKVCEATGWTIGQAWLPAPDRQSLECSPAYYCQAHGLELFRAASEGLRLPPGGDLPGQVWAARRSAWIQDVTAEGVFLRGPAAAEVGLKAGVGIPILAGDALLAVLEFFMFEPRGEDQQLLDLITAVAAQLGTVLQRKRTEDELAHERDLLHTLMEHVPVLIYFKDRESRYVRINQEEAKYLGAADPSAAIGKTDFDFYPEALAREFHADESYILRTGEPLLDKLERQTGDDATERWLLTTKVPIYQEGHIAGLVGVSRDVTELKQVEAALRAGEAKYRSLIENLEQNIFLKDHDLRFVAANRNFCRLLGCAETAIVGKTDLDFYPPQLAAKYRADDLVVLREGQRLEIEEQNLVRGQARTVRVIKTPVRDAQGRIAGVLGIFWDVTEQRALEAQLRQAQKMEAIGQLAGGIAHDFNNLLTAILGNLALVLPLLPEGDPNRDLLQSAEQATLRAADLTHQLLGFSRRSRLRLVAVDINASVEETIRILRRTIDPRIVVEVLPASEPWAVRADPGQINQVLMNLCLNARDAMAEGGRMTVQTANVVLDEQYARLHLEARPGEFVCLSVSDTGCGISPEIRARIYEPFFTTKGPGKGTGLGLAMVFGILKQHQGWIDCYSEPGRGTRFHLYLPRYSEQQELAPPPAASQAPPRGHETILLVDDEVMIRDLGRTILHQLGYVVLLAEDGQEGVEIYRRERQQIDLVILDLTMPRLSGRDALRQMRRLDPQVRVLFASGYSPEHVDEAASDCTLGFVSKPYRPEELARTVRAALDTSRTEGISALAQEPEIRSRESEERRSSVAEIDPLYH